MIHTYRTNIPVPLTRGQLRAAREPAPPHDLTPNIFTEYSCNTTTKLK
jgi:hypothetical protein